MKSIRMGTGLAALSVFAIASFAEQSPTQAPPPAMLVALGWSICPLAPQLCDPQHAALPGYEPDVLLLAAHGPNTIAFRYQLIGIGKDTGEVRTFTGSFPTNANTGNGTANSITIYAGNLSSAFVTITEIQGPDANGNPVPPVTWQGEVGLLL
jgi:hypothetical protein